MKTEFHIPVEIQNYTGKVDPNALYRIGTVGDPATNWSHTESLIKSTGFKNFFCITKLQSVAGYTGLCNRLQVSVDPLNPEHFELTLNHVEYLLEFFPETQIILRIRSCASSTLWINILQRQAIDFAKKYNLTVLETRIRFRKKSDLKKYCICDKYYSFRKNFFRPHKGISFLKIDSPICDKFEKSCKGCLNCVNLWKEINNAQPYKKSA